jgi:hypothetical protein
MTTSRFQGWAPWRVEEAERQPDDLFPETRGTAPEAPSWSGQMLDKWGSPRITVRLLPLWEEGTGWICGWFVLIDRALDEWHPEAPDAWRSHAHYPWHRTDEMPRAKTLEVALGQAARGARMVMEQMLGYVEQDVVPDARQVSAAIEERARQWLTA